MTYSGNGMRFTNEIYATKNEVSKILNISLIDKIWAEICEYRSQFSENLSLKSIDGAKMNVCLCPSVASKMNSLERKINNLSIQLAKLYDGDSKNKLIVDSFRSNLRDVANSLNINVDDATLEMISVNNISAITPDKIVLQKYSSFLNKIYASQIDDDLDGICNFINETVKTFINPVGDNIYRTTNDISSGVYDNLYLEAPANMVEDMVDTLVNYCITNTESYLIKITSVIYYLNYVKPFDTYNELIGSLLSKYIIQNSGIGGVASLINLEFSLNIDKQLKTVYSEVQKTNDLTYLLIYVLDKLSENVENIINKIIKAKAEDVTKEFYKPESATNEDYQLKEKESLPVNPVFESGESVSKNNAGNDEEGLTFTRQLAITNLTMGYSEEKAQKVEDYLLESNPNLSRSQAYFYARHCTMGNYYTIAQYKHETGCAYETARTSMDKLVSEGYYSKEGYKNKFLYTPIRRK